MKWQIRVKEDDRLLKLLLQPCSQTATSPPCDTPPRSECTSAPPQASVDPLALKLELLAKICNEIAGIFKTEFHAALGKDLSLIKAELQAVKTQLTNDGIEIDAELGKLKGTVVEMEQSLSTCTDDFVLIQDKNCSPSLLK